MASGPVGIARGDDGRVPAARPVSGPHARRLPARMAAGAARRPAEAGPVRRDGARGAGARTSRRRRGAGEDEAAEGSGHLPDVAARRGAGGADASAVAARDLVRGDGGGGVAGEFRGRRLEGGSVPWAVRWCRRHPIGRRDPERTKAERGVRADPATMSGWAQRYAPENGCGLRWRLRRPGSGSGRVDETRLKVRGRWTQPCRAAYEHGAAIHVRLPATRDAKAAERSNGQALRGPKAWEAARVIGTDRAPGYGAALAERRCLQDSGHGRATPLGTVVGADHGGPKRPIRPVRDFGTSRTIRATIGAPSTCAPETGQAALLSFAGEVRLVERASGLGGPRPRRDRPAARRKTQDARLPTGRGCLGLCFARSW